jgi:NAD(P)-dependent dehydrogenase (short-subunit alcohol dehydrogenase family)
VDGGRGERPGTTDADFLVDLYGLPGRVALVTGARQGIGRALALALARAGCAVAVTSRRSSDLAQLAGELADLDRPHLEIELDVRSPESVRVAVEAVVDHFGQIDIVVNNAGLSIRTSAIELALDDWDAMLETNLRGAFLVAREASRRMDAGGRIVNISSVFARWAHPQRAAYAATKAGLEQLTRVLALEWAHRGITVNGIALTTVETETRRDLFATADERAERIRAIPLGRLGVVDDAIGALLLLTGDAGRFITGHTIVADGGFTLGSPA